MASFIKIFLHFFDSTISMRNCVFNFFGQFGVGLVESFGLKIWVPTKISASPRLNYLTWSLSDE